MIATTERPVDGPDFREHHRLSFWTVLLSSSTVCLPILVAVGVEALFDAINPARLEVRQPLAYLREMLGYGFGVLALLLATIVVCALLYRQRGSGALVLPIVIVVGQPALGLGILCLNGVVEAVGASYVAGE